MGRAILTQLRIGRSGCNDTQSASQFFGFLPNVKTPRAKYRGFTVLLVEVGHFIHNRQHFAKFPINCLPTIQTTLRLDCIVCFGPTVDVSIWSAISKFTPRIILVSCPTDLDPIRTREGRTIYILSLIHDSSPKGYFRIDILSVHGSVGKRQIMASVAKARMDFSEGSPRNEATSSAVSWAAVVAGAFVAAALALSLLALGTGIGLSLVSPWSEAGFSFSSVGTAAIIWMILVQIIASAMGGYLAGRMRTKWVAVHVHEVYFRDTAHGFLVWSVGLVITAVFFATAAVSMAARTPTNTPNNSASGTVSSPNAYFVDSLFRSDRPVTERPDASVRAEAGLILARAVVRPDIPQQDKTYLAGLVARATGISQAEAEIRVSNTIAAAKQVADDARKATAHVLYWLFVALLIGAFCASYSATIGGRQRDHVPA